MNIFSRQRYEDNSNRFDYMFDMKTYYNDGKITFLGYLVPIVICIFIIFYILYRPLTKFEKEITVKDKYINTYTDDNYDTTIIYVVVDNNNNKYHLVNLISKLDFNKEKDFNSVEIDKTYKINGYGLNFLFLNQNITSLKPV